MKMNQLFSGKRSINRNKRFQRQTPLVCSGTEEKADRVSDAIHGIKFKKTTIFCTTGNQVTA